MNTRVIAVRDRVAYKYRGVTGIHPPTSLFDWSDNDILYIVLS